MVAVCNDKGEGLASGEYWLNVVATGVRRWVQLVVIQMNRFFFELLLSSVPPSLFHVVGVSPSWSSGCWKEEAGAPLELLVFLSVPILLL